MSRVIPFRRTGHKASDGSVFWWIDGELHREDGPAVEYVDGSKEWFLNGKKMTEGEHFNLSPYFQSLPEQERLIRKLMIR